MKNTEKKTKVVWLCHFANDELKGYFDSVHVNEVAPWINALLAYHKSQDEIELHVVAPNLYNNSNCSFEINGINYHFYAFKFRFINPKIYTLFRHLFGVSTLRIQHKIKSIITTINPDLIHLHGAENPYYSAGILPLMEKYPVLLTIQGFIRNSSNRSKEILSSAKVEEEIIRRCLHIGIATKEMDDTVQSLNPLAKRYYFMYPSTIPHCQKETQTESSDVDCVFFARVCKDKGIEDLLRAISILKQSKKVVSLHVIGGISNGYYNILNRLCKVLDIEDNVRFLGFIPTQQELFNHVVKAKICVLPTYHDVLPGTIIECMFMRVPVIAYATGGIPELNDSEQRVVLVEKYNINALAKSIISVLENSSLRESLAEKAYDYAVQRFDIGDAYETILQIYSNILNKE